MIYFKRKNGSVFGKVHWIKKSQINAYLKDGCVQCDEKGVPLQKPTPKKKNGK